MAIGCKNDPPASVVDDSTVFTLDSVIALLKAIKNLNIDIKAGILAGGGGGGGGGGDPDILEALQDVLAKLIDAPATEANQRTLENIFGPITPTPLNISFDSTVAQTIIPAPGAGYRIRITSLFYSVNATVTMGLRSGITLSSPSPNLMVPGSILIGTIVADGFKKDWLQPLAMRENEAFVMESSTADQVSGQVCYYIEEMPGSP
jgi:hypothetical protein